MFTGIVKGTGIIEAIEPTGGDVRLRVRSSALPFSSYEVGESIAVSGVCLTAVALHEDGFDTDVSRETLAVTTLGKLERGSAVNLEPALGLGDRLGGHLVTGHVDCVGTVVSLKADARSSRLTIELPGEYRRYVARKGSVCIDGISLTVNAVVGNTMELNIVPHTAKVTTMGFYSNGSRVNIEVDLLARYVERLLLRDDEGINEAFLREHGYV